MVNWFALIIAGALLITAITLYFLWLRIKKVERYTRSR